jgi:mannose-6-phosphate isomerase-like protein (cupin superfamily)
MLETQEMTQPVVDLARETDEFRKVLWTADKTQLVLMAIPEGGEGHEGHEGHEGRDQLLCFVAGTGVARIGDVETDIADDDVGIVPSGVFHNVRNTGPGMLKLFTTYIPPEHVPGSEHATKVDANADE